LAVVVVSVVQHRVVVVRSIGLVDLSSEAFMKVDVFDLVTNEPVGTHEIPDDILLAAERVRSWMEANNVHTLCGLINENQLIMCDEAS
jgi:hypothetical protein